MTDQLEHLKSLLPDRYAIERELGAGGMATVYLAHDLKHDRKVAVKVLKPELAAVLGAERFLNEIKVTANLQHPHILPLHDSGEAEGFVYYVMPYVEGESLRAKLEREKELSIEEAIEITKGVASALDYAHRQNVIHRDIKPENILLHEGQPVVADFGIALAVSAAGGTRLTETGLSLGTPQYMSPEQAMGDRELDGRSDIYSLACVTYEMLVGEAPHTGPTAQAIVTKIVTEEATPVTRLRKSVPPNVAAAVGKALQKLPADRFGSAAALASLLAESRSAEPVGALYTGRQTGNDRLSRRERLVWLGTVAVAVIGAATLWTVGRRDTGGAVSGSEVNRLSIDLPAAHPLSYSALLGLGRHALAISRDGRTVAYVGRDVEDRRLFVRALDEFEPTGIEGTEGAYGPFFSWDGRELGFFVGNLLKKVHLDGGHPVDLAEVANPMGGTWGPDGTILYSGNVGTALYRVPSSGGEPEVIARVGIGGAMLDWPRLLPDGNHLLHTGWYQDLWVMDLTTGADQRLALAGGDARYLPSGYLMFTRGSDALAVAFDLERLVPVGPEVPVLTGVRTELYGAAQFDVSETGVLVFAPGGAASEGTLVAAGRDGSRVPLEFDAARYGPFMVSPDRRRLAAEVWGVSGHIMVYDLERGVVDRVTREGNNGGPVWSPSGDRIAFWSDRLGSQLPFIRSSDGSGMAEPLRVSWRQAVPTSWSRGDFLAMDVVTDATGWDVVAVGLSDEGAVVEVASTDALEWGSAFSPDGRWIAYTSDESGAYQVYVTPFPPTGWKKRASRGESGEEPLWSPQGSVLYYRSGRQWMAVTVSTVPDLDVGPPSVVLEGDYTNLSWRSYDIAPDGERFLVVEGSGSREAGRLGIVQGWFEELRMKVAAGR